MRLSDAESDGVEADSDADVEGTASIMVEVPQMCGCIGSKWHSATSMSIRHGEWSRCSEQERFCDDFYSGAVCFVLMCLLAPCSLCTNQRGGQAIGQMFAFSQPAIVRCVAVQ